MGGTSRFVMAVLIAAVLAALGWGCGGGADTATTSSEVARSTSTVAAGGGDRAADRAKELLMTQLKTTDDTPTEYVDAVNQGRPVVLLFYVAGSVDDAKVLQSITRLRSAFEDYVFLLYDYKTPGAYGDLSTLLSVGYPPELVLVDGTGTIREIWNGYVDEGTLNQSLVNLGRG